ncbi:hypothetical protein [Marinithermus hydrothermalis]|uniref:Uncharacterized protein n=1 Tax=Marinithermus hydrothermalis (strain DSM 14884 / JCM 11576 / T1) TaxID=869210 RepID=F2NM78_MARHT|nr:hypothetical protein [Marinithermus hydrothermalis]AEB11548.1 hypothetical protein Marky_0800 [Marinithermus hydrothermalis DSM 14884]
MELTALLEAFIEQQDPETLAELAETLEDDPRGERLVYLAWRAVYLEDERLAALLEEAVREAQTLLEELRRGGP